MRDRSAGRGWMGLGLFLAGAGCQRAPTAAHDAGAASTDRGGGLMAVAQRLTTQTTTPPTAASDVVVVEHPPRPRVTVGYAETDAGAYVGSVVAVIRAHMGAMRACYALGLRDDPNLVGYMLVSFDINAEGAVTTIGATGLAGSASVRACVTSRVQALRFPSPARGTESVRVPFELSVEP